MLEKDINNMAVQHVRNDQSSFATLALADAGKLSKKYNISLSLVEKTALGTGIIPERFARNAKTIQPAEQLKLFTSHVAIIGLGGLGGAVVDILARTGIGNLTLTDGDVFDETNLNRQLLSTVEDIGKKKSDVAAKRVNDVNPAAEVDSFDQFFTDVNAADILKDVDVAVDCLDSIVTRFTLEKWCAQRQIPLVSAAVAGTSGQAITIMPGDEGFSRIYSGQSNSSRGIESILGTLCYAAYHMATVQCAETIALLLGRTPELRNRLYMAEISDHTGEIMEF